MKKYNINKKSIIIAIVILLIIAIICLFTYKIINDEIYNKYIFGSTNEREIKLYKNGMPSFIVAILNHDGQLNNIEIQDNGECSGNSDYQNYKNTKDDFVQYHLERYIK